MAKGDWVKVVDGQLRGAEAPNDFRGTLGLVSREPGPVFWQVCNACIFLILHTHICIYVTCIYKVNMYLSIYRIYSNLV